LENHRQGEDEMDAYTTAGSIIDILSLASLALGVAMALTFVPKIATQRPQLLPSSSWLGKIGITLSMIGFSYLLAMPLLALFGMAQAIAQITSSSAVPPSSTVLTTAWGVGSWLVADWASLGLWVFVFAAFAFVATRLRSRLDGLSFLASLSPLQYWWLVFTAAAVAWEGAHAIVIRTVLIQIPELQATAWARGPYGFLAGFVAGFAALVVIALILYYATVGSREDLTHSV